MEITIPEDVLKALQPSIEEAILRSLDGSAREQLIKAALTALVTPTDPRYGGSKKKSPLQEMFEMAFERVCREIIDREMANASGAIRTELERVAKNGIAQWVAKDKEKMASKIADSIDRALAGRDY